MVVAIVLIVIAVATVLFHFFSPWWLTPLASNWQQMDDTLTITFVITGVFFLAVNLFVAYAIWRFRHREGSKAAWQPYNHKLEHWLIAATTLGIIGLLAPGLFVYAAYVAPPPNAMTVEVLGQQWQWRFRLPGPDGKLGQSDIRFVSAANPYGLDPADPAGQQNVLVNGSELHLPVNKPVRMLLRSNDVLHDFFVPPFRARMNIVPGMVTSFWVTPTVVGRYEAMCAQLCGVGHPNMHGTVVVEDEASFQAWLKTQPTFAASMAPAAPTAVAGAAAGTPSGAAEDPLVAQGKALAQAKGCAGCHSVDGSSSVGPTWKGLYGKTETMADGSTALVDDAYVKAFVRNPQVRVVKGFAPIMPKIPVSDDELNALLAYIEANGVKTR